MLCELSVFERLMPTYKDELWEISKFIRNKVWDKIDDERLSILLSLLNTVYQVAVDVMGENFEILLQYIQVFVRKLKEYMGINVETEAYELLQKMLQQKIQDTIKMQWAQLNPNMVEDSEKYEKNLLQILDDFWANISSDTREGISISP